MSFTPIVRLNPSSFTPLAQSKLKIGLIITITICATTVLLLGTLRVASAQPLSLHFVAWLSHSGGVASIVLGGTILSFELLFGTARYFSKKKIN